MWPTESASGVGIQPARAARIAARRPEATTRDNATLVRVRTFVPQHQPRALADLAQLDYCSDMYLANWMVRSGADVHQAALRYGISAPADIAALHRSAWYETRYPSQQGRTSNALGDALVSVRYHPYSRDASLTSGQSNLAGASAPHPHESEAAAPTTIAPTPHRPAPRMGVNALVRLNTSRPHVAEADSTTP